MSTSGNFHGVKVAEGLPLQETTINYYMKPLALLTVGALIACMPIQISAIIVPETFHITETDQGLTTDIPGASVTGVQDHWTVTLTGAYKFETTGSFQLS